MHPVRLVTIAYDPNDDSITLDAGGISPAELRGIVSMAHDLVHNPEEEDY